MSGLVWTVVDVCGRAMERGCIWSGDLEESPDRLAEDLARRRLLGLGARFDRSPQLRFDTHRHDIVRTRSHCGSTPMPGLEGFDVVAGCDDQFVVALPDSLIPTPATLLLSSLQRMVSHGPSSCRKAPMGSGHRFRNRSRPSWTFELARDDQGC